MFRFFMGYGLYGLWVVFPVGCIPIRPSRPYRCAYRQKDATDELIQYCARIRDTDFPQKLPVVPYTCALSLIGADSIFWPKIYFA